MANQKKTEGCENAEWEARHREILDKIQNFCYLDDIFMTVALKNNIEAVECILRIILQDPKIQVIEVIAQDVMPNLYGRGVRLDIHAIDKDGRHFNVEIQRAKEGVSPRRSRHNGAILDMEIVPKGGDPKQLPEVYVLFICEQDPFGYGFPVYAVDKHIRGTEETFDDGMHYMFSNTSYFGDDDFGKLSRDFKERDPNKMHFKPLAAAAAHVKNNQEGVSEMCQIMEDWGNEIYQEGVEKGVEKGVRKVVKSLLLSMKPDEIAKKVDLPLDFVLDVAKE